MKAIKSLRLVLFLSYCLLALNSHAQSDLFKDLLAWYPMTGNANNALGTGMNCKVNNATLTTDRFGHPNAAYYFDGNANLLADMNTHGATALSFSAWIKTDITSRYEVILQSPYAFVGYVNRFTPGRFMAAFDANSWNNDQWDESQTNVADGHWVFVAASNDGNTTRLYVNGVLEGSYPEMLLTANSQLEIGGGVGNTQTQFVGSIDDVRIYKRALKDEEVIALYHETDSVKVYANKILDEFSSMSSGLYEIDSKHLPPGSVALLYDMQGRLIFNQPLNREVTTFDLRFLCPAIYVVNVYTVEGTWSRKILKN